MFETSLPTANESRRSRRRVWALVSSALLHLGALGTLVGLQAWRVEAVAEPPANEVFQVLLPAPMPAPALALALPEVASRTYDEPSRRQAATRQREPAQPPALQQPQAADIPAPPARAVTEAPAELPQAAALPDPASGSGGDYPAADAASGTGDGGGEADGGGRNGRAANGGDGGALPLGGAIRRPEIVPGTKVQPIYTDAARLAHVQGSVLLQATIDEEGNVIDLRVLKSLPMGLEKEAVKAVSQWKFTPALLRGRPVRVFFTVTVQYETK